MEEKLPAFLDRNKIGKILELIPDIPVVDVEPSDPPKQKSTIVFYSNGATKRVYFFFNGGWGYVALTT